MVSNVTIVTIGLLYVDCVKTVQIRSFFRSVFSRIRTEYGPEKTPYLETFHAVVNFLMNLNMQMLQQSTKKE